jgi:hypothetical protein
MILRTEPTTSNRRLGRMRLHSLILPMFFNLLGLRYIPDSRQSIPNQSFEHKSPTRPSCDEEAGCIRVRLGYNTRKRLPGVISRGIEGLMLSAAHSDKKILSIQP